MNALVSSNPSMKLRLPNGFSFFRLIIGGREISLSFSSLFESLCRCDVELARETLEELAVFDAHVLACVGSPHSD